MANYDEIKKRAIDEYNEQSRELLAEYERLAKQHPKIASFINSLSYREELETAIDMLYLKLDQIMSATEVAGLLGEEMNKEEEPIKPNEASQL